MINLDGVTTLVIAPHPDDEVFGCGGLIHRLKAKNNKVYVLYMTVGTTIDFSPKGKSTAQERQACITEVSSLLNLDGYAIAFPGDQYHLKLDSLPQKDLIHAIEKGSDISLEGIRPDLVLAPANSDYNQDHRAVNLACITALRPASPKYKSFQPYVLTYELPYHQWNVAENLSAPGLYVKLGTEDLNAKVAALEMYKSQLKAPESPLSVHGVLTLAAYRGLQCGVEAAEAFQINRIVV
jgi:LmbE family N-acetylglucosaminyl deacetylase